VDPRVTQEDLCYSIPTAAAEYPFPAPLAMSSNGSWVISLLTPNFLSGWKRQQRGGLDFVSSRSGFRHGVDEHGGD